MRTIEIIDKFINEGNKKLAASAENMKVLYEEQKETLVGNFIDRVFQWKNDRHKDLWLYSFIRNIISYGSIDFAGELRSFVSNYLLDDSYFNIEWRKPYLDEKGDIQFLPGAELKTVITTKDDPKSRQTL